jgi:hypothetical protein
VRRTGKFSCGVTKQCTTSPEPGSEGYDEEISNF